MSMTKIITRVFFTLVSTSAFTLLGGIVGSLIINTGNKPGMGWDRLADFLGWVLVSLLIGLIASIVMAFKLSRNQIVKGIIIAVVILVTEFIFIYMANVTNLW